MGRSGWYTFAVHLVKLFNRFSGLCVNSVSALDCETTSPILYHYCVKAIQDDILHLRKKTLESDIVRHCCFAFTVIGVVTGSALLTTVSCDTDCQQCHGVISVVKSEPSD